MVGIAFSRHAPVTVEDSQRNDSKCDVRRIQNVLISSLGNDNIKNKKQNWILKGLCF